MDLCFEGGPGGGEEAFFGVGEGPVAVLVLLACGAGEEVEFVAGAGGGYVEDAAGFLLFAISIDAIDPLLG